MSTRAKLVVLVAVTLAVAAGCSSSGHASTSKPGAWTTSHFTCPFTDSELTEAFHDRISLLPVDQGDLCQFRRVSAGNSPSGLIAVYRNDGDTSSSRRSMESGGYQEVMARPDLGENCLRGTLQISTDSTTRGVYYACDGWEMGAVAKDAAQLAQLDAGVDFLGKHL